MNIHYLNAMDIQTWQLKKSSMPALLQTTLLLIGDATGLQENALLNQMLAAIGFQRDQVVITNTSTDPLLLQQQIALTKPKLLLALGSLATQFLLDTKDSFSQLRGKIHSYGPLKTPLIITYHPTDLLKTPADKRYAFQDLQLTLKTLEKLIDNANQNI